MESTRRVRSVRSTCAACRASAISGEVVAVVVIGVSFQRLRRFLMKRRPRFVGGGAFLGDDGDVFLQHRQILRVFLHNRTDEVAGDGGGGYAGFAIGEEAGMEGGVD